MVDIWDPRISGDGEIKVGFGRKDRDSNFSWLYLLGVESETTERPVDILVDQKKQTDLVAKKTGHLEQKTLGAQSPRMKN